MFWKDSLGCFPWQLRVGRAQEWKPLGPELAVILPPRCVGQSESQALLDSRRKGTYTPPLDGRN